MEIIRSLEKTDFNTIFLAFDEAFKDYEMVLSYGQLIIMLNRRGFTPALSFAAFNEDKIVSFTLNGTGVYNGIKTAYDTGTGTIAEYRGKGLASGIFEYSIPFLKEAGINQYLLEVLQHNTKAVSVYRNLGFEVSREFTYFVEKLNNIKRTVKKMDSLYHIKPIEKMDIELMAGFWDFVPSWQNSFDAILRKPSDFKIIGAYYDSDLVGYCIFEPQSGDLTQIAVKELHRRKGIASVIFNEALKYNNSNTVKAINTELDCDSINCFLQSLGFTIKGKQFEMIKQF